MSKNLTNLLRSRKFIEYLKVFQNQKSSLRAAKDNQWGRQFDMPALTVTFYRGSCF